MLTIQSLNKSFGARRALVDVTLAIPRGQMIGVIGRSGAGKSTLLRSINRLIEPSAGRILHEETDVGRLKGRSLHAWRARCAMIFQQFNLVGRLDVVTNVLVGRLSYRATLPTLFRHFSAEERAIALRALERLDMHEAALQRADSLSGGQQQRVAIARALVQQPDILLADEPIASLDPRNASLVMDALRKVNREDGITVICNLHSLDIACEYSDRIIGLAHGRVVFDGAPSALTGQMVRAIYDMDATHDAPREAAVKALEVHRRQPRPAIARARA